MRLRIVAVLIYNGNFMQKLVIQLDILHFFRSGTIEKTKLFSKLDDFNYYGCCN